MGRSMRLFGTAATLAGPVLLAGLLAGCQLPFGGVPASEPNPDNPVYARNDRLEENERGALTGFFSRAPVALPDAVPVPMREATLERGYGGVIIRTTGVAPTQGYFNAVLVPDNGARPDEAGVVTLRLMAIPPLSPQAIGPERSRLLMTAAFMDELKLRGVRTIRVISSLDVATLPVPARPVPAPPPEDLAEL